LVASPTALVPLPGDAPSAAVLAALAAALCWTLSSLLWRRWPTTLTASELNLVKNLVALALQLPLLLLLAQPWQLPLRGLLLLVASGVVGIAVGDSLFFAALRRLGSRRTLTIDAGGPAAASAMGGLLLGEWPLTGELLGIALISLAVLLVAYGAGAPRAGAIAAAPPGDAAGDAAAVAVGVAAGGGVALAVGALFCGSGGALLSRAALLSGSITPLQAATVRLAAAAWVALPLLVRRRGTLRACWVAWRRGWRWVLPATLLGTSGGLVLQQQALAGLPGGLAVALMATAPVLALPLAWWWEGDPPGWRGTAAALAALAGVSLLAGRGG
jgi:DME family drug/metabolite transporter